MPFYDITGGATHYHADYVTPAWSKTKTKTVEIQDHIFFMNIRRTKKQMTVDDLLENIFDKSDLDEIKKESERV